MDLKSDLPFWTVRNGLLRVYPPLDRDLRCDALVIGGGISGALLAHQLVSEGVDCILIDRRDIGFGSTSASTALLQYEIDTPLYQLQRKVGPDSAERAYRAGIQAIARLNTLAGNDCGFALRPSLQVATHPSEVAPLKQEYESRRKLAFPVSFLSRSDLSASGIVGRAAIRSDIAGEVDPYRLTHKLLRIAMNKGLHVYDRTAAVHYHHTRDRVTVKTDRSHQIRCRRIFFATGYETMDLLKDPLVNFKSTYALISEPVDDLSSWKDRALLWGCGNPYLYMRTTSDNRVIVGGEDDRVLDPDARDRQIHRKTKRLQHLFHQVMPRVKIEPAFGWAGLFGSSKDGLAYIGSRQDFPNAYFALGFGGNGITFSEIASRILTDLFLGRTNPDASAFRFDR